MSTSLPQFIICLVLSQQLMRFSRINALPRWEKFFRNALIFSFLLIVAQGALHFENIIRWIWYVFLVALASYPFRQKVFYPMHNFVMAFIPYIVISLASDLANLLFPDFFHGWINYFSTARLLALIWLAAILFNQNRQKKAAEKEKLRRQQEDELNRAIAIRKVELEELVAERTAELTAQKEQLEQTLADLTAAQSQLIYSEKMASLGELTAGVAHEMQNPLNFVNNFSEVSIELLDEMKSEMVNDNKENALAVAEEIKENLEKIMRHGKSADAVVKGMLLHSRKGLGTKEPTDINALADEYLRLSYFSLRAKDKLFYATLKTDFDPALSSDSSGKIEVFPQELGRVILNLINNAFYAVREKKKLNIPGYVPTVSVSTKRIGNNIEIIVRDNGTGIPSIALSKIFQPFFTTKPTGEGTGLGLSLSYDIVTKVHGGELTVETEEGEFTAFTVSIPV